MDKPDFLSDLEITKLEILRDEIDKLIDMNCDFFGLKRDYIETRLDLYNQSVTMRLTDNSIYIFTRLIGFTLKDIDGYEVNNGEYVGGFISDKSQTLIEFFVAYIVMAIRAGA